MKKYYSHTKSDKKEDLLDHLRNTGDLASFFASAFGAGELAGQAGLLHDLGKHTKKFQDVLVGTAHGIDHSAVGAEFYWNTANCIYEDEIIDDPFFAQIISNVIQSHHSDLHGELTDKALEDREYMAYPDFSIPRNITDNHKENALGNKEELDQIRDYVKENGLLHVISSEDLPNNSDMSAEGKMLFERMIFSCLVDADYSSTAAFFDDMDYQQYKKERTLKPDEMLRELDKYRASRGYGLSDSGLNGIRNEVYEICKMSGRKLPVGLYTLTAPTGTGKTHALMRFALEQAKKHGQKRIFVVLPYLSIIEQNASEYREIFGKENCIEQDSQSEIPDEIKL
jgi:CRISPR-associated endonuclease/helicase Cas3